MQQTYDTRAMRAAAARMRNLADEAGGLVRSDLPQIERTADALRGDTARAIESGCESLAADLRSVVDRLSRNANALLRYAQQLEEADRRAREMIQSK